MGNFKVYLESAIQNLECSITNDNLYLQDLDGFGDSFRFTCTGRLSGAALARKKDKDVFPPTPCIRLILSPIMVAMAFLCEWFRSMGGSPSMTIG